MTAFLLWRNKLDKILVEIQEALILEDLLFAFRVRDESISLFTSCIEGLKGFPSRMRQNTLQKKKIRCGEPLSSLRRRVGFLPCFWHRELKNACLDHSLCGLVERVLPLATHYTSITAFIEQRSSLDYSICHRRTLILMKNYV